MVLPLSSFSTTSRTAAWARFTRPFTAANSSTSSVTSSQWTAGSRTLTTITVPAPWSKMASSACGMVKPESAGPNLAASSEDSTWTGVFTGPAGAVPTRPTTALFTTTMGTPPFFTSMVSTPCRKFAAIMLSPSPVPARLSSSQAWSSAPARRPENRV